MSSTPKTALTLDVFLWNEETPEEPHHHQIVTGLRERMRAKTHFKKPIDQVLSSGDEAGMAYLAWLGCQRYGIVDEDVTYEQFLDQVFAVDPEGVGEGDDATCPHCGEYFDLEAVQDGDAAGGEEEATTGGGRDD